jgi:pyruvate/2-oxoglutarate/acetoin dehydrogenase E1 component
MSSPAEAPAAPPASLRYKDALGAALADELRADEDVCLLGIDIAAGGGVYGVTQGLLEEFGAERVRDTPISEAAFVGIAVGAAATGLRPVVELMYMDFLGVCLDPIMNQAAKLRYMTGGGMRFPLVVRTQVGPGRSSGAQHSQSLEAMVAHIPGLKVVIPGTVGDAYTLLRAAIRTDDPVVFVENRRMYNRSGVLDDPSDALPLGCARVARTGRDVTVVTWSRGVEMSLRAAGTLAEDGIEVEVVDLRGLVPLDLPTVLASVKRTNRLVVVHEAVTDFGAGAEIAARVVEQGFDDLDAPILRVGQAAVPLPFSPTLEALCMPSAQSISDAVRRVLQAA